MRDYLQAWAFRTFNDMQGDGYAPPTHEQVADLFEARVRERAKTWHPYDGRGPGLNLETVATMADKGANAALRDWSETWIAGRRTAGRKGGSLPKPPRRKWTDANLDALAALPAGLTRQQQADALGLTLATTKRLWTALRERDTPELPPVERSQHAPLTKRQEWAEMARERSEREAAHSRATEAYRLEREREQQEHTERLARFERYAANNG